MKRNFKDWLINSQGGPPPKPATIPRSQVLPPGPSAIKPKITMKLTVKDYRAVLEVVKEINASGKGLVAHCRDRIAELENVGRKQYRCIKNSFPFQCWTVGVTHYESKSELEYSEHPFHFEEIKPDPVKEPISWEEAHAMLVDYWSTYACAPVFKDIMDQIKADHLA